MALEKTFYLENNEIVMKIIDIDTQEIILIQQLNYPYQTLSLEELQNVENIIQNEILTISSEILNNPQDIEFYTKKISILGNLRKLVVSAINLIPDRNI
jgi:Cu2+-containing amine oxidase